VTLAHLDDFRDEDELDAVEARRVAPKLPADLIERERVGRRLGGSRPEPLVVVGRKDMAQVQNTRKRLRLVPPKTISERPLTRGECVDAPRPCPFISCKYHLALEVTLGGSIKAMRPDIFDVEGVPDLERLDETCVLDVAERAPEPHEISELLNIAPQLVERIEERALKKIRPLLAQLSEDQ
jgi:hypothetical protein